MPGLIVGREISVQGAITGTPVELEKALDFSLLADVRAMIETLPLENARQAWGKKCAQGKLNSVWCSPLINKTIRNKKIRGKEYDN